MKAIVLFLVVGFGLILFGVASSKPDVDDHWYLQLIRVFIIVALLAGILLALPGRVIVDPSGIRQRFWWGAEKRIPWKDFASVIHDRDDGSTIVYGKFESPITFSPYLVGQPRFDREVKVFSRIDEIRDDL